MLADIEPIQAISENREALQLLGLVYVERHWRPREMDLRAEPWVVLAAQKHFKPMEIKSSKYWVRGDETPEPEPYHYVPPEAPVPRCTKFKKGQSGNPAGRPAARKYGIPLAGYLEERLPYRAFGKDQMRRRIDIIIHQLVVKAVQGDEQIRKLLLPALFDEAMARWRRGEHEIMRLLEGGDTDVEQISDSPFFTYMRHLRVISRRAQRKVLLMPWIVEEALARLGERRFTMAEQALIVKATCTPNNVSWPDWWEVG